MAKSVKIILRIALLLPLVICPGCVKPPVIPLQELTPPLIWPPPPEVARIKYLYSISKPEDIGRSLSFFRKVWSVLAGAKSHQMVRPYGICFSPDDVLYVTDPGIRLVHIFDLKGHRYDQIEKFGKKRLLSPIGVAMDGQDRLYVSDSILGKVFVFTPKGEPEMEIGGENQLLRPTGIAIHPLLKRLYVVDTIGHSIKVFDLEGNFLFRIGKRGPGEGEFNFPTSLSIDRNGVLYVNDSLNFRIQVFKPDGEFLYLFGRHGDGVGEFSHPKGVAIDNEGHIYVTDAIFDSIQIFDKEGSLLLYFGEAGQGPGEFWIPTSIYINQDNRIFISDSFNQRVQVFKFLGGEGR